MAMKHFKPYTPSRRNMTVSDFAEVTKKTPEKSLLAKKRKNENYIRLADQYRELRYEIDRQLKLVNIVNWENKVFEISKLQNKLGLLEAKIEKELDTF